MSSAFLGMQQGKQEMIDEDMRPTRITGEGKWLLDLGFDDFPPLKVF